MGVVRLVCVILLFCAVISEATITHQYNFAQNLPAHLSIMFSMSWFGIPSSDPQGAGPDPAWGNWQWGSNNGNGCVMPTTTPNTCNEGTSLTYAFPNEQRNIASKRRPLAGIYSSSARDAEGLARVDLMLSHVRRLCDGGANARLDAWAIQQDSIHGSSRYQAQTSSNYCATCDMAYRAMIAFFQQAQSAGMTNAVMPGLDQTWIFKFYSAVGLSCSSDNTPCINALTQDITDMVTISNQYGNVATRATNGYPIILIYYDGTLSVSQWQTVLQNARNNAGSDFYVIGTAPGGSTNLFSVFDALAPWTQADYSLTNPTYAQAYSWAQAKHAAYISAVASYPGRVAFGSLNPGFDDYTENWGTCTPRVMPRNPLLVQAAADFLTASQITNTLAITWDDWTEGTHFEPDTINGTQMIVALKQGLGKVAGELADPTGDSALNQRWTSYGSARNCAGGSAGTPPVTSLTCPTAAPSPFLPPNGYIRNLNTGLYLTIATDGTSDVIASSSSTSGAALFNFGSITGGNTIQNQATGLYVSAENTGTSVLDAIRPVASTWETFTFTPYGGYFYIEASINSKYLVVQSSHQLLASSTTQSGGSVFAIISPSLSLTTLALGSYKFYSAINGHYLTLASDSTLVATASASSAATFVVASLSSYGGFSLQVASTGEYVSAANYGSSPLIANVATPTSTLQSFLFYSGPNPATVAIYAVVNTKLTNMQGNGQLIANALTYGDIPSSALFYFVAV